MVSPSFLFNPLPCEAIEHLFVVWYLRVSKNFVAVPEPRLEGGSRQDKLHPFEKNGSLVFEPYLRRIETALYVVLNGSLSLIDSISAPICVIAPISILDFLVCRRWYTLAKRRPCLGRALLEPPYNRSAHR